jgi:hypothetical protein
MANGTAKDSIGKPFFEYVAEIKHQRKLKRALSSGGGSYATDWGNLCEEWLLSNYLTLDYVPSHKNFIMHPTIQGWGGTPDYTRGEIVGDIKSPQLKAFCQLNEIKTGEELKANQKDYYWQLVSNAVLTGATKCELLVFCPSYEMMLQIVQYNNNKAIQGFAEWQMPPLRWLEWAEVGTLAYLPEGAEYEPIHRIEFDLDPVDVAMLTSRIMLALNE